jgi:hypothetical protein
MSRRPGSGAGRLKSLAVMAAATITILAFASVGYAAISPITPSSGTVAQGGSTSATFTVVPPVLHESCIEASVVPRANQFSVTFDGVGLDSGDCTTVSAQVLMTVTASSNATPGTYTVNITENIVDAGGDGEVISTETHKWPLTVQASDSSTTTTTSPPSSTTTTSPPSSTTTTLVTTTSTHPQTTTSTTTRTTTTTQPGATTSSTAPGTTVTTTPSTTGGTDPSTTASDTTTSTTLIAEDPDSISPSDTPLEEDPEVLSFGLSDGRPPYDRFGVEPRRAGPQPVWEVGLSDELWNHLFGWAPHVLSEEGLSPIPTAEFLLRSLSASVHALMIPLLIATLVGLWMVGRIRRKVDDDELAL